MMVLRITYKSPARAKFLAKLGLLTESKMKKRRKVGKKGTKWQRQWDEEQKIGGNLGTKK